MISQAHAALRPSAALIGARRDIYRYAVPAHNLTDHMLDSPLLRSAARTAMLTGREVTGAEIDRAVTVTGAARRVDCGHHSLAVLLSGDLDAQLDDVRAALAAAPEISFSTDRDGAGAEGLAVLTEGAALAHSISPDLVDDLIPHVGLVTLLRPVDGVIAVYSASPRLFPGLVMLSGPATPIGAAEMLLHEAAHARYFDMIIVHDLLPRDADRFERFQPSWRRPGTQWPLEQAMAAVHAYAVLEEFATASGVIGGERPVGEESLLKDARARVEEIGGWLFDRLHKLGPDAPGFLGGLLDRAVPCLPRTYGRLPGLPAVATVAPGVKLRPGRESELTVAGRTDRPGDLYLLDADSARVLKWLQSENPVPTTVDDFRAHHQVGRRLARYHVRRILADLAGQDLIAVRER